MLVMMIAHCFVTNIINKDEACLKCGASRYKSKNEDAQVDQKQKKISAKILQWFPLKLRLQRLSTFSKIVELMT